MSRSYHSGSAYNVPSAALGLYQCIFSLKPNYNPARKVLLPSLHSQSNSGSNRWHKLLRDTQLAGGEGWL